MGYCVLNRKEIDDLLDKRRVSEAYVNYEDYPFLPIGLLVDELEKRKKKGSTLPQHLVDNIENIPEQVLAVPLTSQALAKALQDDNFVEQFVNSQSNPFALISETCLFDDSVSWTDKEELLNSLHQIEWL